MTTSDIITVVSGLPRSGTSMMMNMLAAGGLEVLADGIRLADTDNPKGYFEFERVKKLKEDRGWLPEARGKVVKIISQLVYELPPDYRYRVIFMRRHIDEVLKSQKEMLIRRGTYNPQVPDDEIRAMFLKHLAHVVGWLDKQPNVEVLHVNYNEMVKDPLPQIAAVNRLLGGTLNTAAMAQAVDKSLYRNRQPGGQS
jgi:hypothetical protein